MNSQLPERLRIAAKQSCGSVRALADKSGVSERRIASWLAGTEPKINALAAVAAAADVSLDWLATGEGPSSITDVVNLAQPDAPVDMEVLKLVLEMIENWLDDNDRTLAASKKAEVVVMAYEIVMEDIESSEDPDQIVDNSNVIRLLRAAS